MNWNREMTIALVERDFDRLGQLLADMPEIAAMSLETARKTQILVAQAITLLRDENRVIISRMEQLKAARKYQQNRLGEERRRLNRHS